MIRSLLTAATALTMIASAASPSIAAPCRDGKGKFIKCTPPVAAAGVRCKSAKGKFAKCGTPGATPIAKK